MQTNKHTTTILVLLLLGVSLMPGCKKTFLNRPPLGAPTSGTFYQSDAEILEGTGPLYNGSWGGYNGTSLQYIGDIMGGNSTTDNYQGRGAYLNFAVNSTDPSGALQSAYQALWSVVANANVVAFNIKNATAGASAGGKAEGLAECYFMRAAAYYYLTLIWGEVPIIYDNIDQLNDTTIHRAMLLDDWQFQINDLTWCAQNLPAKPVQPGRVTKWSAEGMLARAYMVRSGLSGSGGQRSQSDLDSALKYGLDVAQNSGATLDPSYYDLFTSGSFSGTKTPSECLFALLWVPNGGYSTQNHMQANLAYSPLITQTGDGWGAAFGGSPSLMNWYFNVEPNDTLRRKATVFMPNEFYADINKANGGWLVDSTLFNNAKITSPVHDTGNGNSNDHAFVKKYVIGSPADNGGVGGTQSENLNTYIFRLDDVYLNLAETILGNNASTSDATALQYFNAVRERAGLTDKASIAFSDILAEKKAEFAFEGHAYYDWKEWYYFDPADALTYFSTQNRGSYNITYNGGNSFITFFASDNKTPGTVTYPVTTQTSNLPYPEAELLVSPALSQPPVTFDFSKVKYN